MATGGGTFIRGLKDSLMEIGEVVGIDLSDRAVEAARKEFEGEDVKFLKMDATELEFEEASFDTVAVSNSLHHFEDPGLVLSEGVRVLRPGGHLIVGEMYRDGQTDEQRTHVEMHHWWARIDTAAGITHRETFTRDEIVEMVSNLGLSSVDFYDHADLNIDPHDNATVEMLRDIMERYIERASGMPDSETLVARGEELRERLETIGLRWATWLLAVGTK